MDAAAIAGTYARLGQLDSAVSSPEHRFPGSTEGIAKSLAINPKLRLLRAPAAFERFLRAHSQ